MRMKYNKEVFGKVFKEQKVLAVFVFAVSLCCVSGGNSVGVSRIKCRDDAGRDVDWFLAYKLPRIHNEGDANVKTGSAYSYILPNDLKWQKSMKNVNSTDSMIGRSVHELFNLDETHAYILYNDQPPSGPTINRNGHTKGIILANLAGGIFIQHSVPHFPSLEKSNPFYHYPQTGLNNGQIFFCFSLTLPQLDSIGRILEYTKPNVYNSSIPQAFKGVWPTLEKIVNKKNNDHNGSHNYNQEQLQTTHFLESNSIDDHQEYIVKKIQQENAFAQKKKSLRQPKSNDTHAVFEIRNGAKVFTVFAKSPSFHQEVYADWIAPQLQSGLDVQSWLNGPHAYPSNCTSRSLPVYNIDHKIISGYKFSTHNDHSKWAVSVDNKTSWVCIADLNRMEHQTERGGAIICFSDKSIWNSFRESIFDTQPCVHSSINSTSSYADSDNEIQDQSPRFYTRMWKKMKSYWHNLWN